MNVSFILGDNRRRISGANLRSPFQLQFFRPDRWRVEIHYAIPVRASPLPLYPVLRCDRARPRSYRETTEEEGEPQHKTRSCFAHRMFRCLNVPFFAAELIWRARALS